MQSSPRNFPGTHQGKRRFFSVRGGDSYSQLALLHMKNRIGRIPLREGRLILFQTENLSAQTSFREKGLGIENRTAILGLRLGSLKPGRLGSFACDGSRGSHRIGRWKPFGRRVLAAGCYAPDAHFTPPKGRRLHFNTIPLQETRDTRCLKGGAKPTPPLPVGAHFAHEAA